MKNSISFLSLFVLSTLCAKPTTTAELSQGYRHDSLFVESGRKHGNNLKIRFKDVDVYTSRLSFTVEQEGLFLNGLAGYGRVLDGKAVTRFRSHTHFFNPHYDQTGQLDDAYTIDAALTAGKYYRVTDSFSVAPTIGYGVYIQNFHSPYSHRRYIDSSKKHRNKTEEHYRTTWYSPQAGVQARLQCTKELAGFLSYRLLFPLSCQGTTKLSRRNEGHFKVSEQNSAYKSFGNIATTGLEWQFAKEWFIKPEVELMKFTSHTSGSSRATSFKKATRSAYEARLTIGYRF